MKLPYPLALVRWLDAYATDAEQDVDDARAAGPGKICILVGWLVRNDDKCVCVAGEYQETNPGTLRSTWNIPRPLIQSVELLRVTVPRKGKTTAAESGKEE